jgi:hypothetical protein
MADLYPTPAAGILATPSVAPSLSSSAGDLVNGAYIVAYALVNANGRTKVSPLALIAIDDDEQIDISAITPLPAEATSVDWFVSEEPNSSLLRFIANNSGGGFSINALPDPDARLVPTRNTTGGTGVRFTKYIKHNKQWEEITLISTFEDKSVDTNRSAPDLPQRWTFIYEDKSELSMSVLDDFWNDHKLDVAFDLQEPRDFPSVSGEPGNFVTGVYFEGYEPNDHTKLKRQRRVVRLIKYPA